jgi:hypothetical protein
LSRPRGLVTGWRNAWSSLEPDKRNGVLLFGGIGLIVLVALLIIGYGYYQSEVAYKNDTVLSVGGREFSYSAVERRLEHELREGNLSSAPTPGDAIGILLADMTEEELLRQGGAALGIVLTEEEIDDRIRGDLGVPPDASQDEFAGPYRRDILNSGLKVGEYRELAGVVLLEDRVREHFESQIPAEVDHVDLLIIRAGSKEAADQAKQRLDAGEDFTAVAQEVSIDPSASEGGQAGWTPSGSLPPLVNDAAFTLAIGETSDVIETPGFQYYIVQPRARETRTLDDEGRGNIVDQSYLTWLDETRQSVGVTTPVTTKHLNELSQVIIDFVTGV